MLKINKKLFHKGFTLIELMIAVVILALAIFGIFHAYSVGFMGMADARDRTVAVNYLQQALEDVKNTDFEKISTTSSKVSDGNKEYRIDIILTDETSNLKKVYAMVTWIDRNGNTKKVDSTLSINYVEFFASNAFKITLFAESYNILNTPTSSPYASTEVFAVIKDENGNTVSDWGKKPGEGDITFSLISEEQYGEFSDGSTVVIVTPVEGKASVTFCSKGTFTPAVSPTDDYFVLQKIQASVYLPEEAKTVSDTITIKITDGPAKIILDAEPKSLKAQEGNFSTITASLINAAGDILTKAEIFNDITITFSISGEGKFEDGSKLYNITIPWDSGSSEAATVTLNLFSNGTPGSVNVVAAATNLESDAVNVIFLGPPATISITANPNPIYVDDITGSTISVSLLDANGYITSPDVDPITISLSLTENDTGGDITDYSLEFPVSETGGIVKTTKFSGQTTTGSAKIIASVGGLPDASVTIIVISSLVPDHIKLSASPETVSVGGTSTITAIVYDISGNIVRNYSGAILFDTTLGSFTDYSFSNGIATTKLSSEDSGVALVTVSTSDNLASIPEGGIEVKFYGVAHHFNLEANPQLVKADGIAFSTITATICDEKNIPIKDYSGNIQFSTTWGNFIGDDTKDITNGQASIKLSAEAKGTASVTIVSPPDNLPVIPEYVTVDFYIETTLTLLEESVQYVDTEKKQISFKVEVTGENITIDEMMISWNPHDNSERIDQILINDLEVWNKAKKSGDLLDIVDANLLSGENSILLSFNEDMSLENRFPITVTFYPPVSGMYIIELPVSP
ncbi:MAG TPA: hypothetical protein DEG96_01010 [Candidatus Atribacteria bacterium]|nr:hypothetical protein [Candidatus Atribacteria bacterium]